MLNHVLIVLLLLIVKKSHESQLLNTLKNYEILTSGSIRKTVVKRGVENVSKSNYNKIEDLSFTAFSKNFRLFLTPKHGLLSPNFDAASYSVKKGEEKIYVNPEEFFEGHVFGEPSSSKVSAHFDDNGALTAFIQTSQEAYIVEPAWRHIEKADLGDSLFYKASDVRQDYESQHENQHVCGFVQIDADTLVNASSNLNHEVNRKEDIFGDISFNVHRRKRQSNEKNYHFDKRRCPVKLIADYRFFDKIGGGDTATTVRYIISLIDRVNLIYTNSVWKDAENEYGFTNMGFVIKKILVHTNYTEEEEHYNSVKSDWDVALLLQKFTEAEGSDKFCLVHLFTYQAFTGGVLGLGYIASPRIGNAGGICGAASPSAGGLIYYNTALSSLRSTHGTRVVTREADIVTAHEFGHNWGSPHDPLTSECAPPSAKGGSYIMYTYSVSGYDDNNKQFSPCSRRSIKAVLQTKSDLCFEEEKISFCGNKRVEEGEQCDEDLLGDGRYNGCCTEECKFKPGAVCSPKNSPCCLNNCQFAPSGKLCRVEDRNSCKSRAVCDGLHADCPDSKAMADGVACLDEGECRKGDCVSFCEKQDLRPCICENVTESCFRCCRPMNATVCSPFVMAPRYAKPQVVSDGTRCIHGYCSNGRCKKDVQDFIEHIWNIIEKWDINFFFKFLHDNLVGTVIIISLLFWVPISYWIHRIDQKRATERQKEEEWINNGGFVPPDYGRIEVVRDIKTFNWNSTAV